MLTIATLGPSGTNHELVAQRYMHFLGIENYAIALVEAFSDAVTALLERRVDAILQCAVHPETPRTLGENFQRVFAIDSFIADSRELGIVSRKDVEHPRRLGILLPANRDYTDISRWPEHRNVASLPIIGELLLAGEIDSGLTYTAFAHEHPNELKVDEVIGSPDDVWIVYGLRRTSVNGGLQGWRGARGAKVLREMARGGSGSEQ